MKARLVPALIACFIAMVISSCASKDDVLKKFDATILSAVKLSGAELDRFMGDKFAAEYARVGGYGDSIKIDPGFSATFEKYNKSIQSLGEISSMSEPTYNEPSPNGPFHFVGQLIAPVKDGGFILRDKKKNYFYITGAIAQDLLNFDNNLNLSLYLNKRGGSSSFTVSGTSISGDDVSLSSEDEYVKARKENADALRKAKSEYATALAAFKNKDKLLSTATSSLDRARTELIKSLGSPVYSRIKS